VRHGAGGRALTLAVATLASLLGAEAIVRLTVGGRFETAPDERSLSYRYDDTLGWFPSASTDRSFSGGRTVRVRSNALGFRDHEYGTKLRPRIAFVGDSYVWGYDAEAEERFTERLQERLPGYEVLNLGVSGYGTDQEYLLSQRVLPALRPDVVVLVYASNDSRDNSSNWRYGAYFKPYYELHDGRLELRGVPVPKSLATHYAEHPLLFQSRLARAVAALLVRPGAPLSVRDPSAPLLRAEADFVAGLHAHFAIATVETRDSLGGFCSRAGIPLLDLAGAEQYPRVGHWTPLGHREVAARVSAFLAGLGWI
jgi:lysophospholipase L1-like esterase